MNSLEPFLLGRKLVKLRERPMPTTGPEKMAASVNLVAPSFFGHPVTTIGGIGERTKLDQSQGSKTVVRFLADGWFDAKGDPTERRRTPTFGRCGVADMGAEAGLRSATEVLASAFRQGENDTDIRELASMPDGAAQRRIPSALNWTRSEGEA